MWSVGCCSIGFKQPSPREVAWQLPRHCGAVERGLSANPGGAGVAGAPLGGALYGPPSTGPILPGSTRSDGITGGCVVAREHHGAAGSSACAHPRHGPEDSYKCLPPVRHNLAVQPGGGR